MTTTRVAIVGAGVIGVTTALMLLARGVRVTLIDREGPAAEASAGNAGAFAFSEIFPLAAPGLLSKAPKWLLDPLGPLSVRPAYALKIAPWMVRFWRSSWRDRFQSSTIAQTSLMKLSQATLEPFLKETGTHDMLRSEGQLSLYESGAEMQASQAGWDECAKHDISFRHLTTPDDLAEVQPGLHHRFVGGTFTPAWSRIMDPKLYVTRLYDTFRERGGEVLRAEVTSLAVQDNGVVLRLADGKTHTADKAVIAAGAWSHQLAKTLGDRIPLETERGYNTTLPDNDFDLRCHLTFSGHGFVVSKIGNGIRVGGAVEFGGLHAAPNYRRSEVMLAKAKSFLPALKVEGGTQWMGFRPSLPDSLPAIGTARASSNVIYAFGHGHLGLTQSTGTGRLAADLVTGAAPQIDLTPFNPQRF